MSRSHSASQSASHSVSHGASDNEVCLGLDIGTSAVKAVLVTSAGDIVASASVPLTLETPQPGWAEQDPAQWWQGAVACIRQVLAHVPTARVIAIGISGQMHSSVFLDRDGAIIRAALLWCDGRTSAECREITALAGGESQLRDWVRNPALEGFTLPKVLWLRNHEPDAFRRLSKVMLAKDYIRFKLTGTMACEPSDASGTLMFDPAAMRWSDDIMRAVGMTTDLLPDVGGSSETLGRVTSEVAALTGLEAGTIVVGGGADNACGAAGVGVIAPGEAVVSWGTSGTVLAPTSSPVVDPGLRAHTFCHVVPQLWYVMGVVLSAGGAYAWYRDRFTGKDAERNASLDALLDAEAEAVAPGADGVTFLPYLQGERTPHRNADARAALIGLSLAHTRGHITRAVLEGVCFALRDSLSILGELGLSPSELLLTGGGARVPFLRRLQANVYGRRVSTVNREEGPSYGAALLAAVGAGVFPDLAAATRRTLRRADAETPDALTHQSYEAIYGRFRANYRAALIQH